MTNVNFTSIEVARYYAERVPKIKQLGHEWRGPCPIHKGKSDSFAVESITGLAYCHSKCGRGWSMVQLEAVMSGMSQARALAEVLRIVGRSEPFSGTDAQPSRLKERYQYEDALGKKLFEIRRYEPGWKGKAKSFVAYRWADERWINGLKSTPLVLYRSSKVLAADEVFIVEGEKDVHTLEARGFVATTNPFGAGAWRPKYTEQLSGKSVVIMPDNDGPGLRHAAAIARDVQSTARAVRILELPGLQEGGDCTDWFTAGGTAEELRRLASLVCPQQNPPNSNADKMPYRCTEEGIFYSPRRRDSIQLSNFTAQITVDSILDDGYQQKRRYQLEADVGHKPVTVLIDAEEYGSMKWVSEKLGHEAVVLPGRADHVRAAIQLLSAGSVRREHVFTHTGWRELDGKYYYLHAGGAIGPGGERSDVRVDLAGILPNYEFAGIPTGNALFEAVTASLKMLEVAPDRLTIPVFSAIWRSILGVGNFSLHITGTTGQGKTQLAALVQQHFGQRMNAENLPASWIGTGNATATLAYHAKDAILVVDDFMPGTGTAQQRLNSEADRLLRGQGNVAGRWRLSSDGKLQNQKPPRGLIVSTGEDTPKGQSLNARMLILPFPKAGMNWTLLTDCQKNASEGLYAAATAAFIGWLAPRLPATVSRLVRQKWDLRNHPAEMSQHKRTPENIESLRFGFKVFLEFAQDVGVLSRTQSEELENRSDHAFTEATIAESSKFADNDPVERFFALLRAAIVMGRGHVRNSAGEAPSDYRAWGWLDSTHERKPQPQGACIGWTDNVNLYLHPDPAFAVAQQVAHAQGHPLNASLESLKREINERGLLVRTDTTRRTVCIRKTCEGVQQQVLHLLCNALCEPEEHADQNDNRDKSTKSQRGNLQHPKR